MLETNALGARYDFKTSNFHNIERSLKIEVDAWLVVHKRGVGKRGLDKGRLSGGVSSFTKLVWFCRVLRVLPISYISPTYHIYHQTVSRLPVHTDLYNAFTNARITNVSLAYHLDPEPATASP